MNNKRCFNIPSKTDNIIDRTISSTDLVLQDTWNAVKTAMRDLDPDFPEDGPYDITVKFDGSMHKRGHTSLYSIAVIEVKTGLLLEYEILRSFVMHLQNKSFISSFFFM